MNRPRALLLTHVPLSPGFPSGFSARWHSFVEELSRTFELDVIGVRGIWDDGTVPDEVFVPPDLRVARARVLSAARQPIPEATSIRTVRNLMNLFTLSRFGPPVPGLMEAIDAHPQPTLLIVFMHHMAEDVLRSGSQVPAIFVLEEGIERLYVGTRPLETGSGLIKQLWKAFFWDAYHFRLSRIAQEIVRSCGRRGHIVAINAPEARQFARHAGPAAEITTIPLGIDVMHYAPQPATEGIDIGVFGELSQPRNYRPARELFDAVNELPGAEAIRWGFVGREPHACIRELASPRVTVTGTVPDTRPYYARTKIVAVPTVDVTGSKTTVLKPCSMGRPVVTTPSSLAGLPLRAGEDVQVSEPASMAKDLIALLADEPRRLRLGAAARSAIIRHCNQADQARAFAEICRREAALAGP